MTTSGSSLRNTWLVVPSPAVLDPTRLAALAESELLDTTAGELLDRYAQLAARLVGAPLALVSLVDADREYFRGARGLPEPWASTRSAPLSHSFAQHVVTAGVPLVVADARLDPRLRGNAAVAALGVISYAGVPLTTSGGHVLGAVCAIDHVPRAWRSDEIACLEDLAGLVSSEIELHVLARRAPAIEARRADTVGPRREESDDASRVTGTRLREIAAQVPAIIWCADRALRLTWCGGAGLAALGLAPDRIARMPLDELFGSRDPELPATAAARRALLGHSSQHAHDVDGRRYETYVEPLRAVNGVITGAIGLSVDVTSQQTIEAQVIQQAFHDPLTGLANRALFRDRVEHAIARRAAGRGPAAALLEDAARAPIDSPLAVIYLDLDDFRSINASFGRSAADEVLCQAAARLLRATRGCDTVARIGGDEFAVLLEGMGTDHDAARVVDRIATALRGPVRVAERELRLVASLGVAYARLGDSADGVLESADAAMHMAKASGKGRHAVFEPAMHASVVEGLELEADLRLAVESLESEYEGLGDDGAYRGGGGGGTSDLRLVYQPLVDLADGGLVSFEALLRWTRCGGAPVSPATFIPVAEETGLIVPLSRWVLREACAQAARWRAAMPDRDLRVAVNISGRHLEPHAGLLVHVKDALERSGLPGNALTLEITESTLMRRTDATMERLAALKALGVRLAIDDFGTGYSSLAYLQRFHVDVLKIDKAFVDNVANGAGDAAIARMIVALGETLGLRTVAEGVERDDQRLALAALGCDFAQGYLFARPLEADAAATFVGEEQATRAAALPLLGRTA